MFRDLDRDTLQTISIALKSTELTLKKGNPIFPGGSDYMLDRVQRLRKLVDDEILKRDKESSSVSTVEQDIKDLRQVVKFLFTGEPATDWTQAWEEWRFEQLEIFSIIKKWD